MMILVVGVLSLAAIMVVSALIVFVLALGVLGLLKRQSSCCSTELPKTEPMTSQDAYDRFEEEQKKE